MSELDTNILRRELLLEQAINQQLDVLVPLATETVLILERMQRSNLEENQVRNLVNVAGESRSVEVVANFIRYQIARKGNDWGTGSEDFGHTIIKGLYGKIKDLADGVIHSVRDELTRFADHSIAEIKKRQPDPELVEEEIIQTKAILEADFAAIDFLRTEAYTRLMLLYLGYLNRAFYFYKKMREKGGKDWQFALESLQEVVKHKKEVANAN